MLPPRPTPRRALLAWLALCSLFVLAGAARAGAQTAPPVLLSETNSTRALALDSATFVREPFRTVSLIPWSADRRTRVMLFAINLRLQPGEDLSVLTANAEDAARRRYELKVEHVSPLPGHAWMSGVILRLNDELPEAGDVLLELVCRGSRSNRVRVGIGHVGGGPADDAGAAPTPPVHISGRVFFEGNGFGGVPVTLGGADDQSLLTDAGGAYSFIVAPSGDYTLTALDRFFDFNPPSRNFLKLNVNQVGVDFLAVRKVRAVGGRVLDDAGAGLDAVTVTLRDDSGSTLKTATTGGGGFFSFTGLPVGQDYTITPAPTSLFNFTARRTGQLEDNVSLEFRGARRGYAIRGRVTEGAGVVGLGGAAVELVGAGRATTTDAGGNFSFENLAAGFSYTVAASKTPYVFDPPSQSVAGLDADREVNFKATPRIVVSGRVTFGGAGLGGVALTLSGPGGGSATTDEAGNYSITATALGDYVLTASKAFYDFSPPSRALAGLNAHQSGVDFNAVRKAHAVRGQVRDEGGVGISDILVTLAGDDGAPPRTATTDAAGLFNFPGVPAGFGYTATPGDNSVFTFTAQSLVQLTGDVTLSFTGVRGLYRIGGRVTEGSIGLGGVAVELVGTGMQTTTDAGGNYSLAGLAAGLSYTVTPSKAFYDFSPPGRTVNGLNSNQTAVDFSAVRRAHAVRGQVRDDQGQGIPGITLTLTGGSEPRTATTDAAGLFNFPGVLAGFSYTATPGDTAVFTFSAQNTGQLVADVTLGFTGARRLYTISGRVTEDAAGLAGVTVELQGAGWTATTDGLGNYSFADVPAGLSYTVAASKAFYDFSPPGRTLSGLSSNQTGVDFSAVRQTHAVSGQVLDDGGDALANVTLTLAGGAGFAPRTAVTDGGGLFTFAGVPAGFGYTVTPGDNSVFTFTAQSTGQLTGDVTLSFEGVRRLYTISGRVTEGSVGLGGVAVELAGTGRQTTTDAGGNYSFAGLAAGSNFTVVPSKQDYLFTPQSRSLNNLDGDRSADFQATAKVVLTGRVTDAEGRGVYGIYLNLSGPLSGKTFTGMDGSYTFVLPEVGDYTLTPSKPQGFYTFGPQSRLLTSASGERVADFTAALGASLTPSYVLEFDGSPKTVDYSIPIRSGSDIDYNLFFGEDGIDLPHFFWEFWAMPGGNAAATYMLSDGYGGGHALLFGFANFNTSEPGRYQLLGNIWDAQQVNYFASDEGPAPNEWGHFAVGWDGQHIVTYFNGVPVGRTAFAGPRRTPGGLQGGGRLLIGGSDHSNFVGRIAQVRGFEGRNPREGGGAGGGSVYASFTPETVFGVDGNLLSYYFKPSDAVADLSLGHNGRPHEAVRRGTIFGVINECVGCPVPEYVVDPTAPDFSNPDNPGQPPAPVDPPATTPDGALVFDSFSRRNSTYTLGGLGGLQSTEGGAAGETAWRSDADAAHRQPFGILNGRAVLLADRKALAWVPTGSDTGDLDIRVRRRPGTRGTGHNTGLAFRVVDSHNYFFAYTSEGAAPQTQTLSVGFYEAGVRTELATGVALPEGWTTLRVLTTAGGINVFADESLVYTAESGVMATAAGAGLYNNGLGLGLTNRWDDFTVFDAQP